MDRLSTRTSPHRSSSKLKQKKLLLKKKMLNRKKPDGVVSKFKKQSNLLGTMVVKKEERTSKPSGSVKVEKATKSRSCADQDSSAMKRAIELQENLPLKFPSFVKSMLPSHVRGGFWLGFPKPFTDEHLPKEDVTVVLIDEDERKYNTKYLAQKTGLSGGWRGFATDHNLNDGDVLIFQLIKRCKFKVYIVRANDLTETDGAVCLLNLDSGAKPIVEIKPYMEICDDKGAEYIESSNSSDDALGSDVMEGMRISESVIEFNQVKSFKSFNIIIDNDLIIDSKIPSHIRFKYYKLCYSQDSFIHEQLNGGLNVNLVSGIILETVNIADGIRSAELTTMSDLKAWDSTLKAFEELGMEVGFLRERIDKLNRIASEHQRKMEAKKDEYVQKEEEMRGLEAKLLKVKKAMKKLNSEMEAIEAEGARVEERFKEVASAEW